MTSMSAKDRKDLAAKAKVRRMEAFGTKRSAYVASGLNAATWDRLEEGLPIRDDRLIAAVKALWPSSGGDWKKIADDKRPDYYVSILGAGYRDSDFSQRADEWISEADERIGMLEERVSELERRLDEGMEKQTDAKPVTLAEIKRQRLLEQAMPEEEAARDGDLSDRLSDEDYSQDPGDDDDFNQDPGDEGEL
ncbi:Protein of unknown function [Propionibacterium freudenreichii]|uniref:hypothetical protein n=1 Tax=Propionibacterium freudenreichii TaxID=1744 RepID=UPI0005423976|nr:hypothetical protein [Propionibacterium freudenreichii]CEG89023.1 Protein of unknown function [Propionibacterium freudenreichii]